MRRLVNGEEVELTTGSVVVSKLSDRFVVRSERGSETAASVRQGDRVFISYQGRQFVIEKPGSRARATGHHSGEIHAPMPGLIVDTPFAEGAAVQKGDKIVVLEAMKTQQPFLSPFDGVLDRLAVATGDQVVDGQILAVVRASE